MDDTASKPEARGDDRTKQLRAVFALGLLTRPSPPETVRVYWVVVVEEDCMAEVEVSPNRGYASRAREPMEGGDRGERAGSPQIFHLLNLGLLSLGL